MSDADLVAGRASSEGTRRFAQRFPELPGHFRRPDRLLLSSLGLGTRAGEPGGVDDLLYRSAVDQLLRGGVNVFDTALSDRMGASERSLGAALDRAFREGTAARDEVFIVSKGGYLTVDSEVAVTRAQVHRYLHETYVETGLIDTERVAHGIHSMDGPFLRDQIERSRRNLRLETLDCYLIEEPELHLGSGSADAFRARLQGAFEALERAVADGCIAAYGLCTWDAFLRPHSDRGHLSLLDVFDWALEVGGGDHHLLALQLPYSVALADALRSESQLGPTARTGAVLEMLQDTGTTVLASAPLAQGRALGRLPDFVREALPGLAGDAQRCLQFARSASGITSAVVGMRDPAHVEENLGVARRPPASAAEIARLFERVAEGAAA